MLAGSVRKRQKCRTDLLDGEHGRDGSQLDGFTRNAMNEGGILVLRDGDSTDIVKAAHFLRPVVAHA
jgi:hypothetical protein